LQADPAYQSFQKNDPQGWATYADNLRGQSVEGAINVLSTLHWNRRSLFDAAAKIRAFEKPVLLATGDEDYYLVEETNTFLSATLPDVKWRRFSGTGHLVNIERSRSFNALLVEFLGERL